MENKQSVDSSTPDYKDTFLESEEHKSKYNMNPNTSDLTNNKNSTLKKIQFYITMVVGVIFIILILLSFLKNILSSEKEEKVVELETPKIQKLEKDNFFSKMKEESPQIEQEKENNPFEKDNSLVNKDDNIFSASIKTTPPKSQIVKGAIGAIVVSNNNKSSSGSSYYDSQIADLEKQRDEFLNMENAQNNSSSNKDFDGDIFTPATVTINEFNPDLLLPKGSYIGCSLDTRFVSAIAGSTSCTVSQNIYSANGNVLLIEKGSKLFGTYKGDNANDGTSRYFVIWQEVRTPNHLRIPLNSGSSDELGGAGLEGEIDHKWMMRFGSSIMLSAVDDMFNVLAYKLTNKNGGSNSGNQIDYTENTRDNASNIASIALEKFINIKPTVYKQHGDLVGVYVNRDVDFSKVYKISKKAK
ncbi:type IV secretion system protein VirB10 [Arcobacter sp. CECT 9188]|uniref:type IV secretion system protein VirB10 n=1 Tax=Arcobacter sp. CECT 9188 TaxID=2044505 RepID=UPI000DEBC253|nr:type IV secretion system protein VirB10 [Arcobacter sp. CECT 9188]RBQ27646.1 type IV secretion system protein VirB10 [Arcobacter sp. CECT 9188]